MATFFAWKTVIFSAITKWMWNDSKTRQVETAYSKYMASPTVSCMETKDKSPRVSAVPLNMVKAFLIFYSILLTSWRGKACDGTDMMNTLFAAYIQRPRPSVLLVVMPSKGLMVSPFRKSMFERTRISTGLIYIRDAFDTSTYGTRSPWPPKSEMGGTMSTIPLRTETVRWKTLSDTFDASYGTKDRLPAIVVGVVIPTPDPAIVTRPMCPIACPTRPTGTSPSATEA